MLFTIVFFTHSLSTYLNYKVIFLNVWYKKLLRGICWVLFSFLLDWSFWSFDFVWKILRLFSHKLPKSNMLIDIKKLSFVCYEQGLVCFSQEKRCIEYKPKAQMCFKREFVIARFDISVSLLKVWVCYKCEFVISVSLL